MRDLVQRFWGGFHAAAAVTERPLTSPEEIRHALAAGHASPAGVTVNTESAMRQATYYAGVRVLAESVAQIPARLMRERGDGGREKAKADPRYTMFKRGPSRRHTWFDFASLTMVALLTEGNNYALKVGNPRRPSGLIWLDPRRIDLVEKPDGTITYRYYPESGGAPVEYAEDKIFHIMGLSLDGVRGLNPIAYQRATLGNAIAARDHAGRMIGNGGKPSGVLETDPSITVDDKNRAAVKSDWESMYGGANAGRTAVLPAGMSFKPVSMSNVDAQFIDTMKYSRADIAAILRVPPHMLADLERATFSNIEHQSLDFVKYSLLPWLVRIEQAAAKQLLADDASLYVHFDVKGLERGDFKSRQEGLQIQRRNGIINANEWRALEDMNPRDDDGGGEYIVERNMGPNNGGSENAPSQ